MKYRRLEAKYKQGDYYKVTGGYQGVIFNNGKWERFDCDTCLVAQGLALNRLTGDYHDSKAAFDAMVGPVIFRHDKELHRTYDQAKARIKARTGKGYVDTAEEVRQEMARMKGEEGVV